MHYEGDKKRKKELEIAVYTAWTLLTARSRAAETILHWRNFSDKEQASVYRRQFVMQI